MIFSGLLALSNIPALAGTSVADSLRAELAKTDDLEISSQIYNQLAWEYRDASPDSSLFFANKSIKISKSLGLLHLQIEAINFMGVAYRNLSMYSNAFEKYLEALRLAEEHGDEEQRGYTLINLGNLFWYQTNFKDAISYFIQALDQARSLGDRRMQAYCYINLARSNDGIGEYGQAELYFKQAIQVRTSLGDEEGVVAAEIELAETCRKQGHASKAMDITNAVINKVTEEGNPRVLIQAYNILSLLYLENNQADLAEQYAFEAMRISKIVSSRYDEKQTLEILSEVYSSREDFKKAFDYYVNYSELNQQLFSEENIRKIEQLKNQYEIEKQEAENEFLRTQDQLNRQIIDRQRLIIFLTILGILLVGVIAALILRAYLTRKKLTLEIVQQKDKIEQDKNTIEEQSKKLLELDQAKSQFFANISHDLRSPLSLILGNLEMITDDEDTYLSPRAKKNLEVGYKNSKRLLYLTDEINDITKLEEGKISLNPEDVRVNSYLKMLSDMFKATADYKGVKLGFETSLDDSEVFKIDPKQFEKIFYNLVSNAIAHTQKGDIISIKAEGTGQNVIITFKDTGEGISRDNLPYIFDRFYQTGNKDYKSRQGMGIGLALVRDLVELHEGEIKVQSKEGKGSEFIVMLKRKARSAEPSVPSIESIKEQHNVFRGMEVEPKVKAVDHGDLDKPAILLVDDHPEIRFYIRQILEDQYLVMEAAHGLEAIQILKEETVDLILTDLMMPWMDGFELIEAINSNESFRKIPLLVVSARISGEDREKVLHSGVNDYLHKPFSKKELVLRIENLLKQKAKYSDDRSNVFASLASENLESFEKEILTKLETTVKERIGDPNLSVYTLTDVMAASERQVYRLVKKLTGLTPYEYITEIRMQYADYLIRERKVKNATEAAKSIGLKNVTTFSKQYEKKFGIRPGDLLKQ